MDATIRERWFTPSIRRQLHKTIDMLIDAERLSSLPHSEQTALMRGRADPSNVARRATSAFSRVSEKTLATACLNLSSRRSRFASSQNRSDSPVAAWSADYSVQIATACIDALSSRSATPGR